MISITEILIKFSKQKAIKDKIAFFYKSHGNGFEKWLQFELLHWLDQKQGHQVFPETSFETDKRRTKKYKNQIDLVVNLKGQSNKVNHAIELKVTKSETGTFRKAVRDLMRLALIKESEWNLRSVTAMVICEGKDSIKYANYLDNLKEKEKHSWIFECIPIQKGGASIYLFTWRASPRKAKKEHFVAFVKHLTDTARDSGLDAFSNQQKKRKS